MATITFDRDSEKAASALTKHDVTFEDATTVFLDVLNLSGTDPDVAGEERWITIGETASGRLVVVVHTWIEREENKILVRVVSARRATRREMREYREGS